MYLVVLAIIETILSLFSTISFIYTDTLNYADSLIIDALGIQKLLQNIYSSTWWALILTIDVNKSPKDLFFSMLLVLPIIIINIIVYKKEKEVLESKKTSKK